MVDGVTPHFDPSKPGARRYRKPVPGNVGDARGRSESRPHDRPSFGKNTYADSDQKRYLQHAPSNKRGKTSRLGRNASRAIGSLSDPGKFASVKGQPKMPSTSEQAPNANGLNGDAALRMQDVMKDLAPGTAPTTTKGEDGNGGLINQAQQLLPARPSDVGNSETKKNDESGEKSPTDKLSLANNVARAKDVKPSIPSGVDPAKIGGDMFIDTMFGKGTFGKTLRALWDNKIVRSIILGILNLIGPECCAGCCAIGLILLIVIVYGQLSSKLDVIGKVARLGLRLTTGI
jgi:hypothetical protein